MKIILVPVPRRIYLRILHTSTSYYIQADQRPLYVSYSSIHLISLYTTYIIVSLFLKVKYEIKTGLLISLVTRRIVCLISLRI